MATEPKTGSRASPAASIEFGALLGTLTALIYGVARFRSPEGFITAVDNTPRLFFDFAHYYYATAVSFQAGQNEVGGYLYSPLLAIVLMPLVAGGFEFAMAVWSIVQALALALLVLRTSRLGPWGSIGGFLAAVLTLLSTATLHSIKWGQVGLILGVLIIESIVALTRRRQFLAAVLLGSAIALKFYPAIVWPLAAAMKRVKAALGALAVSAALLALPALLVLGERRTRNFYRRLMVSLSDNSSAALSDSNSQAVAAWLRRQFDWDGGTGVVILGIAVAALALGFLHFGNRASETPTADSAILAGLLLPALVPFFVPSCWPLYFCTLPALTLLTADQWRRRDSTKGRALVLGILILSGVAQTFPAVDMAGGWDRYVADGWLLAADLAVGACALGALVPLRMRMSNPQTP